ncbi:MAG: hypothetical protein U9N73_03680 [Candidatus Auribacterota bacterium]|nr:hypothetical protein [Candidatus Auribacterota bacterium]
MTKQFHLKLYCLVALCLLWTGGCKSISRSVVIQEVPDLSPTPSPAPSLTPSPSSTIPPPPSPTPSVSADRVYSFNPPAGVTIQMVTFSDRDGDNEIYLIDCGSGEIRALTDNAASDLYPSWSPDRQLIVFVSDRDGDRELYLMAADGSNPERLTDNPEVDSFPAWSPDNKTIAYFSRKDGKDILILLDLDSKTVRELTAFEDGTGGTIVFSPEGKTIYFGFERMDKYKIYMLELPDGSPREIIGHAKKKSRISTISDPDGVGLLYVSGKGNQEDVWLNYVKDGRFTHITKNTASDHSPSFSADGGDVVFSSRRGGDNWQIFTVTRKGKAGDNELTRITDDEFNYYYPECK